MQTFTYDQRYFNLDDTLANGQVFRWQHQADGWWLGVVEGEVIKLRQDGDTFTYGSYPTTDNFALLEDYFTLKSDLAAVHEVMQRDPLAADAVARFPGLRMMRQNPEECLLSFVASTANSVPQIAKGIDAFSAQYGTLIGESGGKKLYTFPTAQALAAADPDFMGQQTGLGWRGINVVKVAKQVAAKPSGWLLSLREARYVEAKYELMQLVGVGAKIADCVCAFSLDKGEAVPVDTHIFQLAVEHYLPTLKGKTLTDAAYNKIAAAFKERFGNYASLAQQYLFYAHFTNYWGGKSPLIYGANNGTRTRRTPPRPQG